MDGARIYAENAIRQKNQVRKCYVKVLKRIVLGNISQDSSLLNPFQLEKMLVEGYVLNVKSKSINKKTKYAK